jgi:hypothetical protein
MCCCVNVKFQKISEKSCFIENSIDENMDYRKLIYQTFGIRS